MDFYTNVTQIRDELFVRGFENGKRIKHKVNYKPYLFVSTQNQSKYTTLFGKKVDKINFDSITEARNFVNKYKDVDNMEFFGMTSWVYPFINDQYADEFEYDVDKVVSLFFDIEVDSSGGFPNIELADKKITTISLRVNNETTVLGYKEYTGNSEKFKYVKCKDEQDLLQKFISLWVNYDPDIISGWNIEFFDIPYIINRISKLLGEQQAKKLSPWNMIRQDAVKTGNKEQQVYSLVGISTLDYVQLDKKFSFQNRESYKLDDVAEEILKEKKLEWNKAFSSLHDMYENGFNTYVEYSAQDTDLVYKMEEKQNFIKQVIALAYNAKINYNDAFTSVRLWDVIIHNFLINKNIVIPQYKHQNYFDSIMGGYVKEPQKGFHKWLVSEDFNSLYPCLIMTLNISPETLRDDYSHSISIDKILNREVDELSLSIKEKNHSLCATGYTFDNDIKGFLPELMKINYNKRKQFKKNMIEFENQLEQIIDKNSVKAKKINNEISKYHNMQMAIKIMLNSAYGALANQYFRFFDTRLAESITASGQLAIRWVEKDVNKFLNKKLKTNTDYVIASDTDSLYITLERIVDIFAKNKTTEQIVDIVDKFSEEVLSPIINKSCEDFCNYVNAYESNLIMKRECIADKGIYIAAKHYVLNVWDKEGVRYKVPKLKMQGIEAVRSSTPGVIREAIKNSLEIIMNKNEEILIEYLNNFKESFKQLPFEKVAFPRGINGLNKYHDASQIFKKGTPIQVRGALYYNKLIKDLKLTNKYERIKEGEKIRFCYLKTPNRIMSHVISAPNMLPKEFDLDKYIDYDMQYEKAFTDPLEGILSTIGWKTKEVSNLEGLFE